MAIKVEDFYNTKFEIEGNDAVEFQKNDVRELTSEEKEDLENALSYYQNNCQS